MYYIYVYLIEKKAMDSKESKKEGMGVFRGRKGKGKIIL